MGPERQVRFTHIEESREHHREQVSFYHFSNSRLPGGDEPGVRINAKPGIRIDAEAGEGTVPLTLSPDVAQAAEPGRLSPGDTNEGDTNEMGKPKKIKIEQTDLDLEQFTHRIYGMLEQKIRVEKEMRGW